MKKILLLVMLIVSVVRAYARTFTVDNTTSYNVSFRIGGEVSTGTCSSPWMSNFVVLPASSNVSYSSPSTAGIWPPGPAPIDWYTFQGLDYNQCHAGLVICGATVYCSLYPSSSSFLSCIYGVTINYDWTEDASGNVTVTFY